MATPEMSEPNIVGTNLTEPLPDKPSALVLEIAATENGLPGFVGLGGATSELIFEGTQRLWQRCMQVAGFTPPIDEYQPIDGGYSYRSEQPASRGYRSPNAHQESAADGWISQNPDAVDASVKCLETIDIEVFGDQNGYLSLIDPISTLQGRIESTIESSTEFQLLQKKWSECMGNQGHSFISPGELWVRPWPGNEPSGDEIAIREADLGCRAMVEWDDNLFSIRAGAIDIVIDQDAELAIAKFRSDYDEVGRKVVSMLDDHEQTAGHRPSAGQQRPR